MLTLFANIFFFLSFVFAAENLDCKTVDVYHRFDKELKRTRELLCFPSTGGFMSANCAKKDCGILRKIETQSIPPDNLFGSIGSPDFRLCHDIGGRPQMMSVGHTRIDSARCQDPEDGSFLDLETLFRRYRQSQNPK